MRYLRFVFTNSILNNRYYLDYNDDLAIVGLSLIMERLKISRNI